MRPNPAKYSSCNCTLPDSSITLRSTNDCSPRYVNANREVTKRLVQHAEKRGIKGWVQGCLLVQPPLPIFSLVFLLQSMHLNWVDERRYGLS